MWMYPSLPIIDKVLNETEEDLKKRSLRGMLTMLPWVKKGVDPEYIMSYNAICETCKGNGYIYVTDTKKQTEVKQCWTCESKGEIHWSQAQVDDLIYNTYFRKRVQ